MTEYFDAQAQRALAFIREHIEAKGYPPSRSEIGAALGLASKSTTQSMLLKMVRAGLIEVDEETARGIRVVVGVAETEALS